MGNNPGDRRYPFKVRALRAGTILAGHAKTLLIVGVIGVVLSAWLADSKQVAGSPLAARAVGLGASCANAARAFVQDNMPTDYNGRDIAPLVLLVAAFFASTFLGNLRMSLEDAWDLALAQAEMDPDTQTIISMLGPLRRDKLDVTELQALMACLQRSMAQHRQHLAFLSIDIVNSTGMKLGEDPVVAERDFVRYKAMVEGVLSANNMAKAAWTPDGVMICFLTTADAVRAGMGVVKQLAAFNREVKVIKHDFAVRVGINAGELVTEDAMPMEQMTDRVIDIAGHMQKHGSVNGVCISKHAIEPLLKEFEFAPADRVVDGCPVYEWKLPAPAAAAEGAVPGLDAASAA